VIGCISKEISFEVPFYDVDPMGIVWHGNYVKYFELARCALLDAIGYGYREMSASGYTFPVTHLAVKYVRSLHYGDVVRAKATLVEYENCLKINYELRNGDGIVTTKGDSSQMAFDVSHNESCFVCPRCFIEKVERFRAALQPDVL
jgi:acyl-CoA thioester hydrolase